MAESQQAVEQRDGAGLPDTEGNDVRFPVESGDEQGSQSKMASRYPLPAGGSHQAEAHALAHTVQLGRANVLADKGGQSMEKQVTGKKANPSILL